MSVGVWWQWRVGGWREDGKNVTLSDDEGE